MPIFEYACADCDRVFEELVRGQMKVRCPGCGSEHVQKLLSAFAALSGARPESCPAAAQCPPQAQCGGGSCMLE